MDEFFDKDYFIGNKKSNYVCYDDIDPKRYFKNIISFVGLAAQGWKIP